MCRISILVLVAATSAVGQVYGNPEYATDSCDAVYDICIQGYTNQDQSPETADCDAQRTACSGTASYTTTTPVYTISAIPTTASCDAVYNGCIPSDANGGGYSNAAGCDASRAACSENIYSTAAPVISSVYSSQEQSASASCDTVYNGCIQSYISHGSSPDFAACNVSFASCVGTVYSPSTSAVVPTVYTTSEAPYATETLPPVYSPTAVSPTEYSSSGSSTALLPAYPGAAAVHQPRIEFLLIGALALL